MTFTAEQYLKENSFSEFDPELNGKSTCVEIETALAAVAMAREEIYEWLSENFFNYFEARMSMFDMCLEDLKQAMKDE